MKTVKLKFATKTLTANYTISFTFLDEEFAVHRKHDKFGKTPSRLYRATHKASGLAIPGAWPTAKQAKLEALTTLQKNSACFQRIINEKTLT